MQYRLFLVITPGLEDLALKEVESKCPISPIERLKGGLELNADLEWIMSAHCLLKIPTRILLRVTDFKVRDFPKLHQKFKTFKWNDFLSHPEPVWEISCSKSRLMHTGRIEETIKGALNEALIRQPLSLDWQKKNYSPQTFYVRIVDDLLTMSLDLSGEPLYKRGIQVIKGEAPIRENLASAFLMELFEGITKPFELVDPMCGSGTFITEALNFHRPLHERAYSFETAPFFKGKHLKLPNETSPYPITSYQGFDLNQELVEKINKTKLLNLKALDSVKNPIKSEKEIIMICNPPYGERIKISGQRGAFLKEAWKKFLAIDKPLRFGWVLPSDMDDLFNSAPGYRVITKRKIKNGGLAVTYWIWERV
jgi:putative N6-adenine-specific DNA methylase